jgi:Xaa-Pro aminopeptidase
MRGLRFPKEETARRLSRIRKTMERRGIDFLTIFSSPGSMRYGQRGHVMYLSGYEPYFGNAMVIIPVEKGMDSLLQTDSADYFPSKCTWIENVVSSQDPAMTIARYMREARLQSARIGFVGEYSIPPQLLARLRRTLRNSKVMLVSDILEDERAVKSEHEISCIKEALEIAKKGIDAGAAYAKPGLSERMVTGEIERQCRLAGSEGFPHNTMVTSGTDEEHLEWWWYCGDRKLRKGDPWNIDLGTMFGGYCCDIARSICLGRASRRHHQAYEHLVMAFEAAMESALPGEKASEVNRAAEEVMSKHFEGDFSGIGHGVGLEVHEWPFIGYEYILNDPVYRDRELKENMVISVEPQVYLKEFGYIQFEDEFVVTESGGKRLSRQPLGLIEIGY